MKFRTTTGAIIEPKTEEVAEQLKKAGYEVIEDEAPASKASKTKKSTDVE